MTSARILFSLTALGMFLNAQPAGQLAPEQIQIGDATIDVTFAPGNLDLSDTQVHAWIQNAADAVVAYFGRFPVARARILVRPVGGRKGVFNGTTWGNRRSADAFTRISIGEMTSLDQLDSDWMMTHELTHMAFPDIAGDGREHHWIEEGMAT